ncbi:hypothetical protein LCGC14_1785560 [marine sediment metagenome]|uniref:Uncharacterized protein n=1 Tax=marine sediment metagenome TaxID=412755 RepID=A0A0F9JTT8_9ZZZZ
MFINVSKWKCFVVEIFIYLIFFLIFKDYYKN